MITNLDQLVDAMGNNSTRLIIDKAAISNTAIGQFHSLWRATGQPGQAAIPATVAVPDHTMLGAVPFTQQTAPATSYLAIIEGITAVGGSTVEIHDRLAHMGGLVGNIASPTTQAVALDLNSLLTTNNLNARKGAADYSDVQWWLEWYTDTGATGVNITVNVTYNDGSTGNLTAIALGATRRASFMQPLNFLIPAADSGKYIRGVNNILLSGSTGGVGNFGITATRYRCASYMPILNTRFTSDWAQTGLPEIPNQSCLFPIIIVNGTQTGTLRATGKIVHG